MHDVSENHREAQTMRSAPDLTTSNAAQGVIVTAIRNQQVQWEQDSTDLACDGRLSNALIQEHWEFATGLLETMLGTQCSVLFGWALDALALEQPSAQEDPVPAFRWSLGRNHGWPYSVTTCNDGDALRFVWISLRGAVVRSSAPVGQRLDKVLRCRTRHRLSLVCGEPRQHLRQGIQLDHRP